MSSPKLPPCPPQLKILQHYIKLAGDYDNRQPVISYWARLYTLQSALKIDRKSPEAKLLLTALMDWLETFKTQHAENEAIIHDVAGQAMIENEAHKLFTTSDAADRAGNFNKNLVKTFYTCGILYDICEVFGDLPEDIAAQRKYAKWKATYIHNCLKNGETPVAGPVGGEDVEFPEPPESSSAATIGFTQPEPLLPPDVGVTFPPIVPSVNYNIPDVPSYQPTVPSGYQLPSASSQIDATSSNTGTVSTGAAIGPPEYAKAQKFCKFAISSIEYEDSVTAISYLQKALSVLTTGKEGS